MAWWGSGASGVHRKWPGGGQGLVGFTGNGLVGSGASGVHREWPGGGQGLVGSTGNGLVGVRG